MKISKWQVALFSICIVTGLLLSVTLQTQERENLNPTIQRSENLASMVKKLQKENEGIEDEIARFREELTKEREIRIEGEEELSFIQKRLQLVQIESGLVPMLGPGISFEVDDNRKVNYEISNYNNFIVHDYYLLDIVTDLRNAGAEAISINSERIVSTSDIKCAGSVIYINGKQVTSPFKIHAIGDPEKLTQGLTSGHTYNILTLNDYPMVLEKKEEVHVPAYKSNYNLKFATIVEKEKEGGN